MVTSKFCSNVALPTLISIIIPITRSKAPAHNKFHFVILYLLHFPTLYPISNVPLPEGRGTLSGNLRRRNMAVFTPSNVAPPTLPQPPESIYTNGNVFMGY
jgi:hypothetical protein